MIPPLPSWCVHESETTEEAQPDSRDVPIKVEKRTLEDVEHYLLSRQSKNDGEGYTLATHA